MDGWMDKKYMKNIWMVDGQKNKMDGWMDGQKKIYEKNMDGWMDKKNGKKLMDGGWIEEKNRWMVMDRKNR